MKVEQTMINAVRLFLVALGFLVSAWPLQASASVARVQFTAQITEGSGTFVVGDTVTAFLVFDLNATGNSYEGGQYFQYEGIIKSFGINSARFDSDFNTNWLGIRDGVSQIQCNPNPPCHQDYISGNVTRKAGYEINSLGYISIETGSSNPGFIATTGLSEILPASNWLKNPVLYYVWAFDLPTGYTSTYFLATPNSVLVTIEDSPTPPYGQVPVRIDTLGLVALGLLFLCLPGKSTIRREKLAMAIAFPPAILN